MTFAFAFTTNTYINNLTISPIVFENRQFQYNYG